MPSVVIDGADIATPTPTESAFQFIPPPSSRLRIPQSHRIAGAPCVASDSEGARATGSRHVRIVRKCV